MQIINVYAYDRHDHGNSECGEGLVLVERDGSVRCHADMVTGDEGPIVSSTTETRLKGRLELPEGVSGEVAESACGEHRLYVGSRNYSADEITLGAVSHDIPGAVYRSLSASAR